MRIRRSILRSQTAVHASCTQATLYYPDPYPVVNKTPYRQQKASRQDTSLRVHRIKHLATKTHQDHHWTPEWVMETKKRPKRYRTAHLDRSLQRFQNGAPRLIKMRNKKLKDYNISDRPISSTRALLKTT
jgi:hypothetical protein